MGDEGEKRAEIIIDSLDRDFTNRDGTWSDRLGAIQFIKSQMRQVERERDKWREDAMTLSKTVKRMGEAAEDRNKVDMIRLALHEQDTATLKAEVEREVWANVERLCDSNNERDAKSDYGIGYQNAMKEISVHAEQQAKEIA